MSNNNSPKKRGKYCIVSPGMKLLLAKQAARVGAEAVIRQHSRLALKTSTLKLWVKKYKMQKDALGIIYILCSI